MSASERLRELADGSWSAALVDVTDALPEIIAVVEAAEKISEPNDYWDWVTGYAPQAKAALAALDEKLAPE